MVPNRVCYNQLMDVVTRPARKSDLPEYTQLLRQTYQDAYTDKEIGLTKECFSKEIFNSPDTQKYLESNLENNSTQKAWLAFAGQKLVGSISVIERKEDYELRGFYVATKHQNKGIGKKLWSLVREHANNKDITCDIYAHNAKTIKMYKKWGFEIDAVKGEFYRHWPEWPESVQAKCIYMRFRRS